MFGVYTRNIVTKHSIQLPTQDTCVKCDSTSIDYLHKESSHVNLFFGSIKKESLYMVEVGVFNSDMVSTRPS